MLIPYDQLSPATLAALIEEFISREGTDYGDHEISLETKSSQIHQQLCEGRIVISYDEHEETCTLIPHWQAMEHGLE
ncbi:YheU family protein [Sulfuriflexus sp.]|uniref:YheU family protein n=1 Tax=Sulfuriflexus sp. TaxID=2015443 RepID=UPI0028CC8E97|nr:YheU family protein [Sulfuriflexus sp.]MDT8404349.1 YheU family protein [Sulfuriflexus sp.]